MCMCGVYPCIMSARGRTVKARGIWHVCGEMGMYVDCRLSSKMLVRYTRFRHHGCGTSRAHEETGDRHPQTPDDTGKEPGGKELRRASVYVGGA